MALAPENDGTPRPENRGLDAERRPDTAGRVACPADCYRNDETGPFIGTRGPSTDAAAVRETSPFSKTKLSCSRDSLSFPYKVCQSGVIFPLYNSASLTRRKARSTSVRPAQPSLTQGIPGLQRYPLWRFGPIAIGRLLGKCRNGRTPGRPSPSVRLAPGPLAWRRHREDGPTRAYRSLLICSFYVLIDP